MRDEKTIVITPENTAEMVALRNFEHGKISIEKPHPFTTNVEVIKIEKPA